MSHLKKKRSKFMVYSSLFERFPSDFFTKSTKRNKSSGSCCYSSRFILIFFQVLLSHIVSNYPI